jgi:polyphosphate kinase
MEILDKANLEAQEPQAPDLHSPEYYANRELSLLEFQRRVLEEAQDESNPLLERVKFLAIVGSNLDEFFMVRVAGLKKQVDAGVVDYPPDGMSPAQQLAEIRKVSFQLMVLGRECLRDELLPQLRKAGIHLLDYAALNPRQLQSVKDYFDEVIYKVVTPLAFDPGHPFPHISNLSLNLAVVIRDDKGQEHFARLKVPNSLPNLIPIKRSSGSVRRDGTAPLQHYFVWLEQLIAANLDKFFPGMEVIEAYAFRVTRDADMTIQELEADDLLETMEQSVRQRRFGSVTRLSIDESMPTRVRDILIQNLEVDRRDVYTTPAPLGLGRLMSLYSIDRPDLKDPPLRPSIPEILFTAASSDGQESNLFAAIGREDSLLHLPYNSFSPVVDFLHQAANDPDDQANPLSCRAKLARCPCAAGGARKRQRGRRVGRA